MSKFCKNCGTQLNPKAKFCGSCGSAVGTAQPPAGFPQVGSVTAHKPAKRSRKGMLAVLALIVVAALGIGFLPNLLSNHDIKPVNVVREPEPPTARTASEATAIALRQYIYARLMTEAFASSDPKSMTAEEVEKMVEETTRAWETAALYASVAEDITDRAVTSLEASEAKRKTAFGLSQVHFMALAAVPADVFAVPLSFNSGRKIDPQTWAENLTKQYDALKGAQRYKQLAEQLGTDARTAYDQMQLAQRIIRDAAELEEAEGVVNAYTDTINTLQAYKAASKVGVFVTATIATGGGTLTTLSTSSFTLAQTAGTIVGGVDCIVDVADTGSSIFLGEDNQVALAAAEVKKYLGPVSSVFGVLGWNSAELGEKLAYVGDSLSDWFFEGKIAGVQVFADRDGGMKLTAQVFNDIGESGLKAALKAAGYVFPQASKNILDAMEGKWKPDGALLKARLDALSAQMGASPVTPEPSSQPSPSAAKREYAWVLVDTVNYDGKEEVQHTNQGGQYEASSTSAPGSYSYTWKYLGETDTYYDPDRLHGESSTSTCTFSVPPSSIQGGDTVTLSMQLAFGAQNLSYFTDKATASADFDQWDNKPGFVSGESSPFANQDGKMSFTIDTYKTVQVYSVSETITAKAPTGSKEGDKIALRTMFNGVKQGTCYIYEWRPIS